MKTIYLAGGCFWGVQKFIDQFEGIISTEVGYANGEKPNPTQCQTCWRIASPFPIRIAEGEFPMSTGVP